MVEAANFAATTTRCHGSYQQSEKRTTDDTWALGETLETTIEKVRTGYVWSTGLETMSSAMDVTDRLAARAMLPRVKHDIVGSSVSVGAYITGHPLCMRRRQRMPAVDKPVLSIGIPMGIVWSTKAEERLNMGAAMLSAVDKLESNGYRCELVAVWRASGDNCDDYSNWVNIEYMLKRAQDRWNPATLAFVMAHPAVTRRLTWRIAETQKQWKNAVSDSYLSNKNTEKFHTSMAGDFDIYFNNMIPSMCARCKTPAGAFEYIAEVINQQLAEQEQ